eukprot:769607-Pyramimonas_sp.AAC.1
MGQETTEAALNILGINLDRKEVKSLAENLPLPWKEWWSHVCKLTSVSQWQSKLRSFDSEAETWVLDVRSYTTIGNKIFQYLDSDGEW